jgi:tRNA nucleotidyltransferase (CCA-adding enzyme)
VLRLGRFAARFGFDIAPETIEFVDELRDAGSLDSLQPDRVLLELHKGFSEASHSEAPAAQ